MPLGRTSAGQPHGALYVTDQSGLSSTLNEVAGRILSSHLTAAAGV